jgi:hypothetical protein
MARRVSTWIAAAAIAACSPGGDDPKPAGESAIVVGVQGEQIIGFVGDVHVTIAVDGAVASDETIDLVANPKALPKETKLTPAAGKSTGVVTVNVQGFGIPATRGPAGEPVLTRSARASFVSGETRLLRIALENRCILQPGSVACGDGQTCVQGRCQSDEVGADQLEAYSPTWAVDTPDMCKPAGHGEPQVIVGTGQTDYLPITDGQELQAERGPQGGHHLWIATRVKNIRQSGSTTSIKAIQPETKVEIPPTVFVFTLDADEGGYCKLYGLRYQLDNGGIDYKQFLGKPLDVIVTVQDQAGTQAQGTAHIRVAPTVIGE